MTWHGHVTIADPTPMSPGAHLEEDVREKAGEQAGGDAEVGGGCGAADERQGHLEVLPSLHKLSLED